MSGKPFVSPLEVYVSAANASEESKAVEKKVKQASRPRKTSPVSAKTKELKTKSKTRPEKEQLPTPPTVEFGVFRCQVCDYRMTVLPGSARPPGGWRCPIDFASLVFASASY